MVHEVLVLKTKLLELEPHLLELLREEVYRRARSHRRTRRTGGGLTSPWSPSWLKVPWWRERGLQLIGIHGPAIIIIIIHILLLAGVVSVLLVFLEIHSLLRRHGKPIYPGTGAISGQEECIVEHLPAEGGGAAPCRRVMKFLEADVEMARQTGDQGTTVEVVGFPVAPGEGGGHERTQVEHVLRVPHRVHGIQHPLRNLMRAGDVGDDGASDEQVQDVPLWLEGADKCLASIEVVIPIGAPGYPAIELVLVPVGRVRDLDLVAVEQVVLDPQGLGQPINGQLPGVATQPECHCIRIPGRSAVVLESGVELPHQLSVGGLLDSQQRSLIAVADGSGELLYAVELLEHCPLQMVVARQFPPSHRAELVRVFRVLAQVLHKWMVEGHAPAKATNQRWSQEKTCQDQQHGFITSPTLKDHLGQQF
ncbi:unnamed protein product [Linum trigynum]|uniref:Uncharacterized protein n=1 Tax=Linum trigynum TaxID=586398 RepID=A0AAV2G785_9ROSI